MFFPVWGLVLGSFLSLGHKNGSLSLSDTNAICFLSDTNNGFSFGHKSGLSFSFGRSPSPSSMGGALRFGVRKKEEASAQAAELMMRQTESELTDHNGCFRNVFPQTELALRGSHV